MNNVLLNNVLYLRARDELAVLVPRVADLLSASTRFTVDAIARAAILEQVKHDFCAWQDAAIAILERLGAVDVYVRRERAAVVAARNDEIAGWIAAESGRRSQR